MIEICEVEIKIYFTLYQITDLLLAVIHIIISDVVNFPSHSVIVFQSKHKSTSHITNMDECSHKVLFVNYQVPLLHGSENEIIHHKVQAHTRRNSERGSESINNKLFISFDNFFSISFLPSVIAYRIKRRGFVTYFLEHFTKCTTSRGKKNRDFPSCCFYYILCPFYVYFTRKLWVFTASRKSNNTS